jgi:hypothetical protein
VFLASFCCMRSLRQPLRTSAGLLHHHQGLVVVPHDVLPAVYIRLAVLTGVLAGHGTRMWQVPGLPATCLPVCINMGDGWGCAITTPCCFVSHCFSQPCVWLSAPAVQQAVCMYDCILHTRL